MLYPATSPRRIAETRKKLLSAITASGISVNQTAAMLSRSTALSAAHTPLMNRMRQITHPHGTVNNSPAVYGWASLGRITQLTITMSASAEIMKTAAAAGCENRWKDLEKENRKTITSTGTTTA